METSLIDPESVLFGYLVGNDTGAGGGGAVGTSFPRYLEAVGALSPNFELLMSFILFLFLQVNLGLSQKIVGQIPGVLSFG